MKFGLCTSFKQENGEFSVANLDKIKECGFDYIEMNLSHIAVLSEDDFEKLSNFLQTIGIEVLATNCLLPGDISVVGEKRDFEKFTSYIDNALARASALKIGKIVFGSGNARNVPSGYDKALALKEFTECAEYVAKKAEEYSITVCIEALNLQESNLITSFEESVDFAKKHAPLKTVLDFFHFNLGRECHSVIKESAGFVAHAHYARVLGRTFPNYADFEGEKEVFTALKSLNYNDTFSFECSVPELESNTAEYKKTLDLFKSFFK